VSDALQDYELRPVQVQGKWQALDANGYGHILDLNSEHEVEIWLCGYDCGARENM
jgi:hypothetical protein